MIDINNFRNAIRDRPRVLETDPRLELRRVTKPETINYRTLKPEKVTGSLPAHSAPTKGGVRQRKYKRRGNPSVCERCGVEVTRSKAQPRAHGPHRSGRLGLPHLVLLKGPPRRIAYLIDMAPKELEKVLYFAASVITHVDEDARKKDLGKVEKEVDKQVAEYERESEQRTQELNESPPPRLPRDRRRGAEAREEGREGRRPARTQRARNPSAKGKDAKAEKETRWKEPEAPAPGTTDGFKPDDELWADTTPSPKRMKAEDREKTGKELRKTFEAEAGHTEAYLRGLPSACARSSRSSAR